MRLDIGTVYNICEHVAMQIISTSPFDGPSLYLDHYTFHVLFCMYRTASVRSGAWLVMLGAPVNWTVRHLFPVMAHI